MDPSSSAASDVGTLVQLFRQAPAAVAWLDGPEHVFRFHNDAYTRLVGDRPLLGRPVAQALPEIVAQGFVDLLDRVYAGNQPHVGWSAPVQLARSGDGVPEDLVVDFLFQPVHDAAGSPTGIFVQATDATSRFRAEAALRESEAKFRAITNSIDQMIWSTRPDGFHDYYNDRWYEFTGMPPGSTDGDDWNGMFHEDDQQRAWAVWRHSLRTGDAYHIEYRLRHRSGAYRWVLGRAQAVRDESGAITRWFGTCTDIQEIVQARDILSGSREALERQVRQHGAELREAEERLRQAQKMEAIGQLTGGIAHDFNNMLQGITVALDLTSRLLAGGRAAEAPRFIEMAQKSTQRAAAMTHRLLAFSRRQPLAPQLVDVNTLVLSLRELFRRTVGEGIELRVAPGPQSCIVLCDPNQLESALLNLTINARDAMPDGGVLTIATGPLELQAIELAASESLPAGAYVSVGVSDTGIGMQPDVVRRAFEPFFTTKPIGQGTGLGLSMVYGFTRQSHGLATIESRPGVGTTVRLLLPRHEGTAAPAEPASAATELAPGAGEVILVAEDDDQVRELLLHALGELGYRALGAADSRAALRQIDALPQLALLLTDVGLPGGLNGRQVADQARLRWPQLQVLFMTGYIHGGEDAAGPLLEGMELVSKPVRLDALLRRVQQIVAATPG